MLSLYFQKNPLQRTGQDSLTGGLWVPSPGRTVTEVGLAGPGVHTADILRDDDLPLPGAPGETQTCRALC